MQQKIAFANVFECDYFPSLNEESTHTKWIRGGDGGCVFWCLSSNSFRKIAHRFAFLIRFVDLMIWIKCRFSYQFQWGQVNKPKAFYQCYRGLRLRLPLPLQLQLQWHSAFWVIKWISRKLPFYLLKENYTILWRALKNITHDANTHIHIGTLRAHTHTYTAP